MAALIVSLFLGLIAALLIAYRVNAGFRARVDADTARRQQRKAGKPRPDPLDDAELWPDPPADPASFDRWFETHGTSHDPRPPETGRD